MCRICQPFTPAGSPSPADDEFAFHGIDINCCCRGSNQNTLVQICFIHTVISIIEAHMKIRRYFCSPSFHVFVGDSRKRKQLTAFFQPLIVSAVILLFEVFMVQSIQFLPEIFVELLQRKVAVFF